MAASLYQEFYKLAHRKVIWIAPIILLGLMVLAGYTVDYGESKLLTALSYDSHDWIMFILVIVGATIFSMEFQNNAILTLLYKASSKLYVYLSKLIVLLVYNLFLHGLALILTVVLRWLPLNKPVAWTTLYQYHQPLWENMLKASALDLITTTLVISIIFLLSCLINNNAVVVSVTFLLIFMGQFLSSSILLAGNLFSLNLLPLVKWNPFNMLNLTAQYVNYITYHATSHLETGQLFNGALLYAIGFFILGYLVFRKKRF